MTALLDTHVIIWFLAADRRLSTQARDLIEDPDRVLYFSAVSAIEISLKYARKQLQLPDEPARLLPQLLAELRLSPLSISLAHGTRMSALPLHHRDPFDRLLIAQALEERLSLVTSDRHMQQYGIPILW